MVSFIKKKIKKLLSDRVSGRNIEIYDSDIFLVSYPKSGNTWLRFLIGNVIYDDFNFGNMEELIPDIYVQSNKELLKLNKPRILKSHEYFDPRYSKVIYIVRDPRSVFLSYFEHKKKMKKIDIDSTYDDYITSFLNGKFDGFGSWSENVNSWLSTRANTDRFLLVKYEDLKQDTEKQLKKIC